jgi:hypothetical protein
MVVISAIVFAWMYSAYFQQTEAVATRAIGVATVTPVATSLLDFATVSSQGGGSSTVTPTLPASPTVEVTQTEDTSVAAATEGNDSETPTEETVANTDCAAEPVTLGEGSHAFVIWALADVWIDVTLDGAPVYSEVIANGCEAVFYGEAIAVNSGNAQLVQIWVDGVDYGDLGDSWDATFVFP